VTGRALEEEVKKHLSTELEEKAGELSKLA
jgi:hypothetical protein